jgi:hypothetical protein
VTIVVDEQGWQATGQLTRVEEGPDLAALCELDKAFELCLPDDSTMVVMVTALTPTGSFTLSTVVRGGRSELDWRSSPHPTQSTQTIAVRPDNGRFSPHSKR